MTYNKEYESHALRGISEDLPWSFLDIVKKYTKSSDVLLDIGCGTAFKTIQLANNVNKIYAMEPNKKMRKKAEENIINANISNVVLLDGRAENLPFENESFDIVTCIVAPHETTEIFRVLKSGGYAIIEKIGDRDKYNLKQEFGFDESWPRWQFLSFSKGGRTELYKKEFEKLFSYVSIQNSFWKTYYSIEWFELLLKQTPTIRNYDKKKDKKIIQTIQKKYTTSKWIETEQNRILIIAKK